MIISKTPLRISFAGGGSDLPSYYKQNAGQVISSSIDKYVYVIVKNDVGISDKSNKVTVVPSKDSGMNIDNEDSYSKNISVKI